MVHNGWGCVVVFYGIETLILNNMNDKRTLIAIRKVLANWNLNCAEESCLKKELANELLWAVKNCNAPVVVKQSELFICPNCNKHTEEWADGICEDCTLKGFTEGK
jgi:hypothetical protein